MKKLSLLIFHSDYESFLENLREKGVVHIHEDKSKSSQNDKLQSKLAIIKHINDVIMRLSAVIPSETQIEVSLADAALLDCLDDKFHSVEHLTQQISALQKDVALYQPWGDFDRSKVEGLKTAGWDMHFFTIPESSFDETWLDACNVIKVNEDNGLTYFVTVNNSNEKQSLPDAEPYVFPELSEKDTSKKLDSLTSDLDSLKTEIGQTITSSIKGLESYKNKIMGSAEELMVEDAATPLMDGRVVALEGWIPNDRENEMLDFLKSSNCYYKIDQPTPEDNVPVLLKNGWYSKLFEPITEMFALPKYSEFDPTPLIAPFFMLFFGLCMGDGGYGLLIAVVCWWFGRKASPAMKGYFNLGIILGCCTIVVGILTGSFFGIALDTVTWPWLAGVKDKFITQNNYGKYLGGYNPMMILAVIIGIIQILFGMLVHAGHLRKLYGMPYARSSYAWVVFIVTAIVCFGLPALGNVLPMALTYALYAVMGLCALVIFFFNTPNKNVFLNIGSGIWGTYNMATGLLGDTLSYIRLFALGLTGGILGGVFNTLALDLTSSLPWYVRFLPMLLILLAGHCINFGLCMIGAFVHPMRLTFVEFYKNAGFEGGGVKYSPFKKR